LELAKKSHGNDAFSIASGWKQKELQEEEGDKNS
jgi:hypothetical protein